jgi:DNA-binding NarL/FixJ family response regulator
MRVTQKQGVLIIDDHPLFREGIKAIIARNNKYEVVGETGTGQQGLELAKKLKPDLALVDISLPDQNGIELARDILRLSANTRVMMVSIHSKLDYIVRAFKAGAAGYLVKESAPEKLLEGMDRISIGDYFMDTAVSHKVVEKLIGLPAGEKVAQGSSYDTLTRREQEVMVYLVEGLSVNKVADKLFISPKTVENHRSNIMRKLKLHNTLELVRYAAKIGLIDVNHWKE